MESCPEYREVGSIAGARLFSRQGMVTIGLLLLFAAGVAAGRDSMKREYGQTYRCAVCDARLGDGEPLAHERCAQRMALAEVSAQEPYRCEVCGEGPREGVPLLHEGCACQYVTQHSVAERMAEGAP
jgi:DNA-directed RNA polymerase subunit RPC12/RpoP